MSQRWWRRAQRHMTEAVSENQWLLPLVGIVLGALLAFVLGRVGESPDPKDWAITVGGARTGLISAISILFAGLSIVLALASVTVQNVVGRFSLRMLRIYVRNPRDRVVIAAFAMAATFILVEWYLLRALAPDALAPVGGVLMSLLLLFLAAALMIWYIGALTSWLRVDHTVRRLSRLTLQTARSVEKEYREHTPAADSSFERPPDAIRLTAPHSGYLADVNTVGLLDLALDHKVEVVIDHAIGRSVTEGEPIGWITPSASVGGKDAFSEPPPGRVAKQVDITEGRELDRAVGYGILVLVDMAIMALSPSVNDPNTAVQVIEEMTFLFPLLAQVRLGPYGQTDAKGIQRVAVRAPTLGDYVEMATTQIVFYSGGDPAVIRALQRLAGILEGLDLAEQDREAITTFASQVRGLTPGPPVS